MNNIDIQKKIDEIRSQYGKISMSSFSALVMGLFGVGKTRLIGTGRRPILIDSFDPKGTKILEILYPDEINKTIFIRPFWEERFRRPEMYKKWEKQWEEDIATDFLDNFGTYAIDSGTTFLDALSNRVSKMKGRPEGSLAIQDYPVIYGTIKDIIKITSTKNVDFIFTAHGQTVVDEETGKRAFVLDVYNRLKTQIPILFTEKYVLVEMMSGGKLDRKLLTQSWKEYRASTQLGAKGVFAPQEEPDIRKLLDKAGLDYSDKPISWDDGLALEE